MEILNSFFDKLIFTRLEEKEQFNIYGVCVSGLLAGGYQRYILLFVPSHLAIKKQAYIYELAWQNLQTRSLQYGYKLKKQDWVPFSSNDEDPLLRIANREKRFSRYAEDDFPFEVLLLHDPKKKTSYQYNNSILTSAALETFKSVFNYIGDTDPITHTSTKVEAGIFPPKGKGEVHGYTPMPDTFSPPPTGKILAAQPKSVVLPQSLPNPFGEQTKFHHQIKSQFHPLISQQVNNYDWFNANDNEIDDSFELI